jgi:trk system potassium uptake protein TrkA
MNAKIAVIGLGLFGKEVCLSLAGRGLSVLAVDQDPDMIEAVKDDVDEAVVMDSTNADSLREARIDEMSVVVCAIGTEHLENSILTTSLLHQFEVPRIIVRAANALHARILYQVGATEVVNPEREMGRRVAQQIASPGVREILRLSQDDVCVSEIPVPSGFVGKTLAGLDVRRHYRVTVIGIQRLTAGAGPERKAEKISEDEGGRDLLGGPRRFILNMDPNDRFEADDMLVVVGNEKDLKRLSGIG